MIRVQHRVDTREQLSGRAAQAPVWHTAEGDALDALLGKWEALEEARAKLRARGDVPAAAPRVDGTASRPSAHGLAA